MIDNVLAAACADFELNSLLLVQDDIAAMPDHVFSKKFERNMKKLIDRMRGGRYHRLTVVARNLLIAAILAAVLIGTVFAFNTDGVKNFFVEKKTDRMNVVFYSGSSKYTDLSVEFSYLPEGFEKIKNTQTSTSYTAVYEHRDGRYIFVQATSENPAFSVYGDDLEIEQIAINGRIYAVCRNDEFYVAAWEIDGTNFLLTGKITKEECLKMVKSLKN